MSWKKHFLAITGISVLLITLTACGTQNDLSGTKTIKECSNGSVRTCRFTLPDSRRVTCLYFSSGNSGGLSCDWAHADGADKGWTNE